MAFSIIPVGLIISLTTVLNMSLFLLLILAVAYQPGKGSPHSNTLNDLPPEVPQVPQVPQVPRPRSSACMEGDETCQIASHSYKEGDLLPDDLPLYDQSVSRTHQLDEEREERSQNAGLNRNVLPPGGLMKMAWVTPILRLNASTLFPNVDVKALNKDLLDLTANLYDKLERQWGDEACFRKAHCSINNKFFDWQRSGGWDNFFLKHKSVTVLEEMMFKAADRYSRAMGLGDLHSAVERGEQLSEDGEPFDENSQVTQLIWATVHKEGIMHHMHDHPFALISGVYYVNVPEGSGDIVLYDPRPQHSHEDFVLTPLPGEFLLFPSWLKHQVQGTVGKDPRISFAFNIDGKWEGTSDIAASYELPLRQSTASVYP